MREATTSMKIFGRLVNARIASVLILLLCLLPTGTDRKLQIPVSQPPVYFTASALVINFKTKAKLGNAYSTPLSFYQKFVADLQLEI